MKHTALSLPWRTTGGLIYDQDKDKVALVYGKDGPFTRPRAEFIVRACNCHEELVEALELAYSNLGATAVSEHTFTHVRQQMREALANATK